MKSFVEFAFEQMLESDQLDEISREKLTNYLSAIKDDESGKDRTKGKNLALKKKWGDPKYGIPAANVPATEKKMYGEDEDSDEDSIDESFDFHAQRARDTGIYDKKVGKPYKPPMGEEHPLTPHYKAGYDSAEVDKKAKKSHERLGF